MKKLCIVLFFLITTLGFSQLTPEQNKMLGIEPRNSETFGCEYIPIPFIFDSIAYFETFSSAVSLKQPFAIPKPEKPVNFLFNKNLILISGYSSNDPKSIIRLLGEIEVDMPKDIWRCFQCEDRAGLKISLDIEYAGSTNIITIGYRNTAYSYWVESGQMPEKVFDVLENIEELGYVGDGNFGSEYTDEEVYNFLSQFGNPQFILNLMLRDLYYNEDFEVDNKPKKWQKQH